MSLQDKHLCVSKIYEYLNDRNNSDLSEVNEGDSYENENDQVFVNISHNEIENNLASLLKYINKLKTFSQWFIKFKVVVFTV